MSENPRLSAEQYLKKYSIPDLFDYLLAQVVLELPDDPWKRLSEVCEEMDNKHSSDDVPFFTREELSTVFGKYEVLGRGYINGCQAKQALRTMGVRPDIIDSLFVSDEKRLTQEAFVDLAVHALRKRFQAWYGQ